MSENEIAGNQRKSPPRATFGLRLLIKHPEQELSFLTERLGLPATLLWICGQPRHTPTGKLLPGAHELNAWGYKRKYDDPECLGIELTRLCDFIGGCRDALADIAKSGGSSQLIIEFYGVRNVGVLISPERLGMLSEARVAIGLEEFP